jgi:arsenite methyltransferase
MSEQAHDEIRRGVRDEYARVARGENAACTPGCCGAVPSASLQLGYSDQDLSAVPEGANMGLGCGNPQAIARLQEGETVLDLGAGGGFDCFLAARQVGKRGRVIGVDMTPDMVSKARLNAAKLGASNVEFRLGEIERLPVADATVDVVLSNCVVNLSPDKKAVFEEAFRVLKPGGRIAISDVVTTGEVPAELRNSIAGISACIGGAVGADTVRQLLQASGFEAVRVEAKPESRDFIREWAPGSGAEDFIASAVIEATKPSAARSCCGPQCCTGGAG